MTCRGCRRPMRPVHARAADHPGTILAGAGGYCITCYNRRHTLGHDADVGLDETTGHWAPNQRGILTWTGPERRTA